MFASSQKAEKQATLPKNCAVEFPALRKTHRGQPAWNIILSPWENQLGDHGIYLPTFLIMVSPLPVK